MSREDFNYRGYLLDLGYREDEIPTEFTEEEKDQLYAQAIQGTYRAYLRREENSNPGASKKDRVVSATKKMIEDIPEARGALGIPDEIIDDQEPYELERFVDFISRTSPGESNLNEPVKNYLDSYSKTFYNEMTPFVRPFLQNVDRNEFKKHFMEANNIDKDTTVNELINRTRTQRPSEPVLSYEVEPEKRGNLSAFWSGFQGFWDMTVGDTKRSLGDTFDRPDWALEGMLQQARGKSKSAQYNFVPKYNGVVETWREVWEKESGISAPFSALWASSKAAVESAAQNAAATAIIAATDIATNAVISVASGLLSPATGGAATPVAAASGLKTLKGVKKFFGTMFRHAPAVGVTGAMMIGEPMRRAIDEGVYDPEMASDALTFGLVSTASEYSGFLFMRGALGLRKGWKALSDSEIFRIVLGRAPVAGEIEATKSFFRKTLLPELYGAMGASIEEGGTEAFQDFLQREYARRLGANISSDEAWKEGWNAFWSAVPLGGGMRLGGAPFRLGWGALEDASRRKAFNENGGIFEGSDAVGAADMTPFNPAALSLMQYFKTEDGKSIVSYGGTVVEVDGEANEAVASLIAKRKLDLNPIDKGENDANITVNDNNTVASIPFREGGGLVTYRGENAKERLSELIDEHNDMSSSPFVLTEGMTIEAQKENGRTKYYVTFANDPLSNNGAPVVRGAFDSLHHPYATNMNLAFAGAHVQEIPKSVFGTQVRGVPVSAIESGQNVPASLIVLRNVENESGDGSRESLLFDSSRNVIFKVSLSAIDKDGKRRVSVAAKTHTGKNIKLDDNVRDQVIEEFGEINLGVPNFGLSATKTEVAGKSSYHFNLDEAKTFVEGIRGTFDEENSTAEKIAFTTASGKNVTARVIPQKGTLLVEYAGELVSIKSGIFDLVDNGNFLTSDPTFGLFGYDFEDATGPSGNPVLRRVWADHTGQQRITLLYYDQDGNLVATSNGSASEEIEETTSEDIDESAVFNALLQHPSISRRFRGGYALRSAEGDGTANYIDENGEYTSNSAEAELFDRDTAEALVASEGRAGRVAEMVAYYEFFGINEDGTINNDDRIFYIGDTETDEISPEFREQILAKCQDEVVALSAFYLENADEDLSQTLSDESLDSSSDIVPNDPFAQLTDEELQTLRNIEQVGILEEEDDVVEEENNQEDTDRNTAILNKIFDGEKEKDDSGVTWKLYYDNEYKTWVVEETKISTPEDSYQDIYRFDNKEEAKNHILLKFAKFPNVTALTSSIPREKVIDRNEDFMNKITYLKYGTRVVDASGNEWTLFYNPDIAHYALTEDYDKEWRVRKNSTDKEFETREQAIEYIKNNFSRWKGNTAKVSLRVYEEYSEIDRIYAEQLANGEGIEEAGEQEQRGSQDPRAPRHAYSPRGTDRNNVVRRALLDVEGYAFIQEVVRQEWERRNYISQLRGRPLEPEENLNNELAELAREWGEITDDEEKLKRLRAIIIKYHFLSERLYRGKASNDQQRSFESRLANFVQRIQDDPTISPSWKYSFQEAMIIVPLQKRLRRSGLGSFTYEKGRRIIVPFSSDNTGNVIYGFIRVTQRETDNFIIDNKGNKVYYNVVEDENDATLFDTKDTRGIYNTLRKLNGRVQVTDFAYRTTYKTSFRQRRKNAEIMTFASGLKVPSDVTQTESLRLSSKRTDTPLVKLEEYLKRKEEKVVKNRFDILLGLGDATVIDDSVLEKIERFKRNFGFAVNIERNIGISEAKRRLYDKFFDYYSREGDISFKRENTTVQEFGNNPEELILQKEREAIKNRDFLYRLVTVFNKKLMGNIQNNNTPLQIKFTSDVVINLVDDGYAGTIYAVKYNDGQNEETISSDNFDYVKNQAHWLFFKRYADYLSRLGRKLQGNNNFDITIAKESNEDVVYFRRVENGEIKTDRIGMENRSIVDFIGYVSGLAMNSFFQSAGASQQRDIAFGNNRAFFQKLYRDALLKILKNRLNKTDFKLKTYRDGKAKIFYEPNLLSSEDAENAQRERVNLDPQLLRTYNILGRNPNLFRDLSDIIRDVDMFLRWDAVRSSFLREVEEGTPDASLQGYHNHSGGARGSDTAWDHIGRRFNVETTNWYPPDMNVPRDLGGAGTFFDLDNTYKVLTKEQELEGLEKARAAWDKIRNPNNWTRSNERDEKAQAITRKLWARSWFQVKNARAIFAVGVLTGLNGANASMVDGDTAAAIQMAMDHGQKPIYFYNQDRDRGVDVGWYQYSYTDNAFKKMSVLPTLTESFAGIGTRKINGNGWAAIADVYRNTVVNGRNIDSSIVPSEVSESVPTPAPAFDFYAAYLGTLPVEGDGIDDFLVQEMNNIEDLPSNSIGELFKKYCERREFQIRFVRIGELQNQLYFLQSGVEEDVTHRSNIEKVLEEGLTVDQIKSVRDRVRSGERTTRNEENRARNERDKRTLSQFVPVYLLNVGESTIIVETNFRNLLNKLWSRDNAHNSSNFDLISREAMTWEIYGEIASTNPEDISPSKNKDAAFWNWKQRGESRDSQPSYGFLSNFHILSRLVRRPDGTTYYNGGVNYKGKVYNSAEAAYQAAKVDYCESLTSEEKEEIKRRFTVEDRGGLTPSSARFEGGELEKRKDFNHDKWNQDRVRILEEIVTVKFESSDILSDMLLHTGAKYIVGGHLANENSTGRLQEESKFWGAIWRSAERRWDGRNEMGKILMRVRHRIAKRKFNNRSIFNSRSNAASLRSAQERFAPYLLSEKQLGAFVEAENISPGASASFRFFDSREGVPRLYEDTGLMSPDGARARSIEDELVAHYGESILAQVASGQIVILENQEAARNFWNRRRQDPIYSVDGVFQGFCDRNGVIYLVRDGIRDGDVHKVVVHEKGVHAGFLGFTNSRDFQSILQYLRDHVGDSTGEGLAIKRAFERAYRATNGNPDEVWVETLAYLCEENADNQYNIIQRFIAAVKRWLFEHGILDVSRFSVDDFVIFAQAAARAPLRQAEMERYDALASTAGNIGIDRLFGEDLESEVLRARNEARRFIDLMFRRGISPFSNRGYNIFARYMQMRGIDYFRYSRGTDPSNIDFTIKLTDGEMTEDFIKNFRSYGNKFYNFFRKYNKKAFTLQQIYINPNLFIAYPELENVYVILTNEGGTYFDASQNTIYIDSVELFNANKKWVDKGYIDEGSILDVLSFALEHEIFHKIQHIEGYTGGNSEEIFINFIESDGVQKLENYLKENYSPGEVSKFLRATIYYHIFGDVIEEKDEKLLEDTNFQFNLDNSFLDNLGSLLNAIREKDSSLYDFVESKKDTLLREIFLFQDKYVRLNNLLNLLKSGDVGALRSYSEGEIQANAAKTNYLDRVINERGGRLFFDYAIEDVILTEDLKSIANVLGIDLGITKNNQNIITGTTNTTEEGTDVSNIDSETAVNEQLYVKTQSIRDEILQDSEFNAILDSIDSLKSHPVNFYERIVQSGVEGENLFAALFSGLMNQEDALGDPVTRMLLLRAKEFLHEITERKEFFGQPREKTNLSSENMKAMANAISGLPRSETLSSTATTPEEAVAVQTNSVLLAEMTAPVQNTFLEYVQNEINSMLDSIEGNFTYNVELIDNVETPVIYENGQPAYILKGVPPSHAQSAVEHLIFRGRVTKNKRPSDLENDDPFWYNNLLDGKNERLGRPLRSIAPRDFSNVQAKLDPAFVDRVLNALPAHIRDRIEIHSNPSDPRTRRLLVDTDSDGLFLPMSAAQKTIHVRDFDISKERFIRAVSEEVGHYSWQLFGNSEMDTIVDELYDLLHLIIRSDLRDYLPAGKTEQNYTTFDKLVLINELFSKYSVNFLDDKEVNEVFTKGEFSKRFSGKYNLESINGLRKRILDEVGTIATNLNTSVFFDNNSTNADFKQFFEQLLITLMSPAHGKSVVASFPRNDGTVTEIRVNDWGQMRKVRPKTVEGRIRQRIMELVNRQPTDIGKRIVMFRFDNLPFNFYSPQWFVKFFGKLIDSVSFGTLRDSAEWIRIPGGFVGDTVVGKDVSILLSRAYQSIYSDYGLRMKKEYVNMEKFADYLRRNNLNPDLVDRSKGYVSFMQENGLDDEKMLKMAEEADLFMQEGIRRTEENVLRIRQEFMNTLNSLRSWAMRRNLTQDAIKSIEDEINRVMRIFKQDYTHRAYRAYTPEDRANINEIQQYLMETDPINFLSNKLAEANKKRAEAKTEFERSQKTAEDYKIYRKATAEADHLQYIYDRLKGLEIYCSGVVNGEVEVDGELAISGNELVDLGSNYTQRVHNLMRKIVEKVIYKNMETRRNKQNKEHSRFNVIAGVMRRKMDVNNVYQRNYMTFLDEIKNPMESILLSLDQQEKILNKLVFNRVLGEKILETGMGNFKSDPEESLSPGMSKIGFGEKGTFLSFLSLETFFDKAFEKEYDVATKMVDNSIFAKYFEMVRANLTVYNPKLAISNYISNIGVGFATGHLFRVANIISGSPIIRDDFLKRFMGREANPTAFQKQILDELVRYQVIGGSSSSTEMKIYTHNNHEKFISFLTSIIQRVTPLSQAGKFSIDNFMFNLLERAREIYGYGDEWLKIIAYLNNREVAVAKYEAEFSESDPNYQTKVREAAAKEAANLTQLEMTTWELSPMIVRQIAGKAMRILTPDFVMHNFQILRMTTVGLGRLVEIGSEIRRISSIQNRTPSQEKYLSLLAFEMGRRWAGFALGTATLGTLLLCPAYLIPYLSTVLVPSLFGGGDDDLPDDESRHSFTPAEHIGAQMLLNSLMDSTNLWAPAYRKDKYTFLATNHQRQDAAQTLFPPPPATETPTLAQYGVNLAKMIIDLSGDNILGQVYNGLRGKDRYGQQVGYTKAFKELLARGVVPEGVNQMAFVGSALTNWVTGEEAKGRTVTDMLVGKPPRQHLAHKSWELVGASVREYDVRDLASSRAYEIKQGIGNAQNPVRRDFVEDVVNNPGMSDSTIVSKIKKMMNSNEQRMGRALYAINGLRQWGLQDNEIIKYLNKSRNAPGTVILSEADARKLVEGKNIFDYHILTSLQEKRNIFATKLGDDSKYTREQRQQIVDTLDRFMAKYKEMMGEGDYAPSNKKGSSRRDNQQPTGNQNYNRRATSKIPIIRQDAIATNDGDLIVTNAYTGDTLRGTKRGQVFNHRVVNTNVGGVGQGGELQDRATALSLIGYFDNVHFGPATKDGYGRVSERYVGDKLSAEEMIGGIGTGEYFINGNVNDPQMLAGLRAASERARVAGLSPGGATPTQRMS